MSMLGLLGEAGAAIILPCSATVVVTCLLAALGGRGRGVITAAVVGGVIVGGILNVGWAVGVADPIIGAAIGGGALAVGWSPRLRGRTGSPVLHPPPGSAANLAGPLGGAVVGLAAGMVWYPCVGVHLATVINTAIREPRDAIGGLVAYLAVLTMPAVLVTGIARTPLGRRWPGDRTATMAIMVLVALGGAIAIGLGDDLTAQLFRWSL